MKRKNFLRDIALGIAATLVPRILMPVIPDVTEEGECVFNEQMINDRLSELRQYPIAPSECFLLKGRTRNYIMVDKNYYEANKDNVDNYWRNSLRPVNS